MESAVGVTSIIVVEASNSRDITVSNMLKDFDSLFDPSVSVKDLAAATILVITKVLNSPIAYKDQLSLMVSNLLEYIRIQNLSDCRCGQILTKLIQDERVVLFHEPPIDHSKVPPYCMELKRRIFDLVNLHSQLPPNTIRHRISPSHEHLLIQVLTGLIDGAKNIIKTRTKPYLDLFVKEAATSGALTIRTAAEVLEQLLSNKNILKIDDLLILLEKSIGFDIDKELRTIALHWPRLYDLLNPRSGVKIEDFCSPERRVLPWLDFL